MDLDTLRAEWRTRDEALQRALERQSVLMREALIAPQLAALRRRSAMNAFELGVYIVFVAGFGLFLAGNWGRWEFFIPALLLHVWTIAMGALTFAERDKLRRVDFSAPVLEIQRNLAALRNERARTFQWAFLTGQVLWWIPFAVVLFWGVFGVDLYTLSPFMSRFIEANIAIGIALIPVLYALARWLGPRLADSAAGRSLLDVVTGRDLAEARAITERLARFEAAR